MRTSTAAVLLLGACAQNTPLPVDGPPVYSTRIVEASDSSGVSSVSCPTTHRIMGGGCRCEGVSDVLFGAGPAGNGFVCGCYDYGSSGGSATAYAICLTSTVAGTLKSGLVAPDPELEAAAMQLRVRRADAPRP